MSTEQVIEIGTATNEQVEQAAMLFGKTFQVTSGWLKAGVERGFYSANVVKLDGVDRYVLVSHVNDQKRLHINAVAQLPVTDRAKVSDFDSLVKAMVKIAKEKFCTGIEGITQRRAMVERLVANGFTTEGVSVYYAL